MLLFFWEGSEHTQFYILRVQIIWCCGQTDWQAGRQTDSELKARAGFLAPAPSYHQADSLQTDSACLNHVDFIRELFGTFNRFSIG